MSALPDSARVPSRCSFCGKSQHDVRKVIAGPAVYICDECVQLCVEILTEQGLTLQVPAGA